MEISRIGALRVRTGGRHRREDSGASAPIGRRQRVVRSRRRVVRFPEGDAREVLRDAPPRRRTGIAAGLRPVRAPGPPGGLRSPGPSVPAPSPVPSGRSGSPHAPGRCRVGARLESVGRRAGPAAGSDGGDPRPRSPRGATRHGDEDALPDRRLHRRGRPTPTRRRKRRPGGAADRARSPVGAGPERAVRVPPALTPAAGGSAEWKSAASGKSLRRTRPRSGAMTSARVVFEPSPVSAGRPASAAPESPCCRVRLYRAFATNSARPRTREEPVAARRPALGPVAGGSVERRSVLPGSRSAEGGLDPAIRRLPRVFFRPSPVSAGCPVSVPGLAVLRESASTAP